MLQWWLPVPALGLVPKPEPRTVSGTGNLVTEPGPDETLPSRHSQSAFNAALDPNGRTQLMTAATGSGMQSSE